MKICTPLFLLLCLTPAGLWGAESGTTAAEEVVLDAPGGRPVAILLSGAPRKMGEIREGYARVTLEGWIRLPESLTQALTYSESGTPEVSPPEVTSPDPVVVPPALPSAAAVSPSPVASLQGSIIMKLPTGEVRYGGGARVRILGPVEELSREWNKLHDEYRTERFALEREIEALQEERRSALNKSDNFTEAAKNRDRATAALKAKEVELPQLETKYENRLRELFSLYQLAETVADRDGTYSFAELPPGKHQLAAVFTVDGRQDIWYLPIETAAGSGVQVDLDETNQRKLPFFGKP